MSDVNENSNTIKELKNIFNKINDIKEEKEEKREKENNEKTKNNNINREEYEFEDINDDEIIKKDDDQNNNYIRYSKSDVELFGGLSHKDSGEDSSESLKELFKFEKNKIKYINPLRIREQNYRKDKNKKTENNKKTKKMAIDELVTNLKTQYILFNVKDFIRMYQIKSNPFINIKIYKTTRFIRNTCLYIYGIVMLFERPWFCYKGTTFPVPKTFNFIENCEKNVEFANIPFIYNDLLRVIEIVQTFLIIVTQIMKYKDEYQIRNANTSINKYYNLIQIISLISLFLCLGDLIISLCNGKFPIVNFILRPFIYIYMIRRLRNNWQSILKVIWKTRKAFIALFTNILAFSIIGFVLFKKEKGFFESFEESVLQMYILLSTCNFPDIMLEAMEFSKFAIIYFVIYISINYFLLLSYLKTLYTTKYYNVNKLDCLHIIKNIIQNKYNKHIFYGKNFNKFILGQKQMYSLNDDEYNNLLILFNLYDKNSDIFSDLIKLIETTPEKNMILRTKYGK